LDEAEVPDHLNVRVLRILRFNIMRRSLRAGDHSNIQSEGQS
jgi:hypothetical protein